MQLLTMFLVLLGSIPVMALGFGAALALAQKLRTPTAESPRRHQTPQRAPRAAR